MWPSCSQSKWGPRQRRHNSYSTMSVRDTLNVSFPSSTANPPRGIFHWTSLRQSRSITDKTHAVRNKPLSTRCIFSPFSLIRLLLWKFSRLWIVLRVFIRVTLNKLRSFLRQWRVFVKTCWRPNKDADLSDNFINFTQVNEAAMHYSTVLLLWGQPRVYESSV